MKKLLLPILIILALPLLFQSTPTEILKLKVFDTLIQTPAESGNFVILNITEEDVDREGGYPFPRQRLAEIHIDLLNEGAVGIGWVISFPQADRMGGDEMFAAALGYAPSVIAMFEDGKGNYPKTPGTVVIGDNNGGIMTTGVKQNLLLLSNHSLQGLAVAPTDIDYLVRRIPLLLKTPDNEWIPSFGTQIYKSLFDVKTYIIKTNDNGISEISIRGIPPVKTDSLGRKWISWVDTPQTDLKEMNVAGKFVFIGVTASGVMPQVATPVGLLEPHKIQAALAESILIQDSPYIPEWSLVAELAIFIAFVTCVWFALHLLGISWGIIVGLLLMSLSGFIGFYFIQRGILVDVSWTLISEFITGSIAFYLRFRQQYKLRQQIKKQFEHYLDPRQVKKLQDDPKSLVLGGERRYCTFLFTDVRGFTAMSEQLEPEQVTEIMNKALTIQADAVKEYGGMVDKYIGDAMMAIFNAPIDLPDHENVAILCAKQIQEKIQQANLGVEIGIGVNTGYAVVGNMGSETRFDYTAIGDAVNLAARLESSTKEVGRDIVIGYDTVKNCNIYVDKLKDIFVKGKEKPIQIYTLDSYDKSTRIT
jgi:adenylate cyclase|tara:strand:+ start:1420 stop:3189 length:1770 start_codon:yes stop_codon:yes gene_type:complete